MSVIAKPGYKFSFFFWLDIISTVSLILDIQVISNAIFYNSGNQAVNTVNLARAGRASRIGTKAGRVVRLVRLIRIVKLYKASTDIKTQKKNIVDKLKAQRLKKGQFKFAEKNQQEEITTKKKKSIKLDLEIEQPKQEDKESRVSKKLSDLTTKRVIVIVLSLLLIIPLFSADYYYDLPGTVDYQTYIMSGLAEDSVSTMLQIKTTYAYLINYGKDLETPLLNFETPFGYMSKSVLGEFYEDFQNFSDNQLDNIRTSELSTSLQAIEPKKFCENKKEVSTYKDGSEKTVIDAICKDFKDEKVEDTNKKVVFSCSISNRSIEIFSSALSMGRTFFVCIILTMGALLFSKDANDLALSPIERMITKVNQIARNPNDAKNQDVIDGKDQYETVIIENAITKIGTLLALGFGDAGSEIIGSNMQNVGDVNPLIPGKKKICIYGFCDIRNFTDATEQLQEKVMLFVNNIGDIVHTMVDRFLGAANKNIGDAFLLIWKLPDDKVDINEDNSIDYLDQLYVSYIADFACVSFMKIQAKINREPPILRYRENEKLLERFPDYQVKIGYGLHIGWSIEGAIGSEFKIDASYLSPNVKMSERLQDSTKIYGVPLLISEDLYNRLSDGMKKFVRQIDRVLYRGSTTPMGLYTIDMFVDKLLPSKGLQVDKKQKNIENEVKRNEVKEALETGTWDAYQFITHNKDLKLITQDRNKQFLDNFEIGLNNYLDGKFEIAKQILEKGNKILEDNNAKQDGPTKVLMETMSKYQFKCPKNWEGYILLND
ncbi:Adenylyl cyclase class-3/4/guanylyl cyclase [Pseudocohnilembus persalinus]|uniref:Adenylyl cyclase class-3/4/guanylyl cyclase n=1 Tax=Pseudocohnilembus persalinus TaxID=266149 RepID=A0A0V0QE84_PSEPJ|nr:Adenylyl cyclase class-3/4/guanylyl cyclase [Pseudocohnilembus persalinus]|eukprot:KRX00510.1 Adenylyl cyclase class-3/4/guanylyl cyclase [Pseudocohnilembus persalinus]